MSRLRMVAGAGRIAWWLAAIGVPTAGLVLMMMWLAGYFQPKVPTAVAGERTAERWSGATTEVRSIRRPRLESAVGTVRAITEAAVASKLLARVVEVNVKAGQSVTEGDVLIRLDDADLQARRKQAQAAREAGKAAWQRASQDEERARQLITRGAISQQDYDAALAALRGAEAELDRLEQALAEAQVLLDFATIRAPLTGIVVDKRIESGDTASPGQVLVTLYEPTRMQLVATVRESLALRLKVGDTLAARLDVLEHECAATVSEIVPEAQAASRSFTVKVTGPCPPGIYSGMFGRIFIPLGEEEVTVVPSAAVYGVGQLQLVDVVEEGQVRRRSIQTGRALPEGLEVLAGLRPGERVVPRTQHGQQEVQP
ncbi:MAG: efflux RND transporter periplasmic adaptor subunit [Pirellulaceae bacterium]